MKIKTVQLIDSGDLDALIRETYGRPYCFQQQEGCLERGNRYLTVPVEDPIDFESDTIPERVNGEDMGVSFAAWLARDPKAPVGSNTDGWKIELFWERNFYPSQDMVLNDLHERGLLPAGEYIMTIDW